MSNISLMLAVEKEFGVTLKTAKIAGGAMILPLMQNAGRL